MTANQMCFFQKLNFYVTTLLKHPSWFQNIGFAIAGILFPIVVGLIIELEKERKVLDLRLIGPSIKPKLILFFVVLYFLVPLVFPLLIGLKYLAFFILCCWLMISICLFYFKLFTPLIGWIFSEEKRWNMRMEYLEKRKNELQKSKSKSQLIHEIAEEWNCVWREKSIPYNKQKKYLIFSLKWLK